MCDERLVEAVGQIMSVLLESVHAGLADADFFARIENDALTGEQRQEILEVLQTIANAGGNALAPVPEGVRHRDAMSGALSLLLEQEGPERLREMLTPPGADPQLGGLLAAPVDDADPGSLVPTLTGAVARRQEEPLPDFKNADELLGAMRGYAKAAFNACADGILSYSQDFSAADGQKADIRNHANIFEQFADNEELLTQYIVQQLGFQTVDQLRTHFGSEAKLPDDLEWPVKTFRHQMADLQTSTEDMTRYTGNKLADEVRNQAVFVNKIIPLRDRLLKLVP